MLVELRDVEVHIEPEIVLNQALQEGDITTDTVTRECISEDGVDAVLDAVDDEDIRNYCERKGIAKLIPNLQQIIDALGYLSQEHKALLLWQLVKREG